MRKWIINEPDRDSAVKLGAETGLGELVSSLLVGRGIHSRDQVDGFLNTYDIADPFLIADMEKAVKIITDTLYSGEKITIYGDYDCDGVTSTVILYNYLTALGGNIDWYIPSRDEGYGLNITAIDKIAEAETSLIITVDNGISAQAEALYIKEKGIKLVITDHHQIPEIMPEADAVINPNRSDDKSPFKKLAGCGVVLKLVMALENDIDSVLEQFADLAAIGTVGDLVPLEGENRHIVERGLQILPFTENIGLHQLLKQAGLDEDMQLTSSTLAFTICPRINAAGRFSTAGEAVELLLSESEELAAVKAKRLTELNKARQEAEIEIMKQVDERLAALPERLYDRVLICEGENWHHGVVGIISSRLLGKYDKPNLVISIVGDEARGSARSYDGFSLYKLLTACEDLLIRYGGHSRAAGFTLKTDLLPDFIERVRKYTRENYPFMPPNSITADKIYNEKVLTIENVEQLSILQPFGEGNPSPVFLIENAEIIAKKSLKDGKYVSFTVRFKGKEQKILNFSSRYEDFRYEIGNHVDILVSLDINDYNDTKSISAVLKDIRSAGFSEDKFFAASSVYENIKRGESVDPRLLKRIIPEKADIKAVYDILRLTDSFNNARDLALQKGLNYCMFSVILDVLEEFKLINKNMVHGRLELIPAAEKVDFTKSIILERLSKI